MKKEEVQKLPVGLYRLYWDYGGISLVAVGCTYDGTRWYAACNWTTKDNDRPMIASTNWNQVKKVELIETK